jgi:CubicO group peptidase (beta-lactamase class C family)
MASVSLDSDFDNYAMDTLHEWNRYGAIVSVLKDGETISKGYGIRGISEESPNSETIFHIASHSKPLTAASIAILVDQGKLDWDDPVIEYIPEFSFKDKYTSNNITIRDILCHRAGLPFLVGSLVDPEYTSQQLLTDLASSEPVSRLRERHSYSNTGYSIAGEVVKRVTGIPWTEYVVNKLFKPLKMTSTYSTISDLRKQNGDPNVGNSFHSIILENGELKQDKWGDGVNRLYATAGGVVTTGHDIGNWLSLNLNGGVFEGKRIINSVSMNELHRSQTVVEPLLYRGFSLDWNELHNPFGHFFTYGLGWFCYDYMGCKVDEHTGLGLNCSSICVVPELNLGVSVCINVDSKYAGSDVWRDMRLAGALRMRTIDYYINASERDWGTIFMDIHKKYA